MPPWRLWALTRSEVICVLRSARAARRREHDLVTFGAWRTATLVRAKKKIPALSRLLRSRKRRSEQEQAEIRAEVAAADAEFNRLEALARERREGDG